MSSTGLHVDVVDTLVPLSATDPLHAVRHKRDKVVAATQGSYDAIFDPALPGLSRAERLLAAHTVARLSEHRFGMGSLPEALIQGVAMPPCHLFSTETRL